MKILKKHIKIHFKIFMIVLRANKAACKLKFMKSQLNIKNN